MRVNKEEIQKILPLVQKLWQDHNEKELVEIITSYIEGKETAVFAAYQGNQAIGAALCSLRHDY